MTVLSLLEKKKIAIDMEAVEMMLQPLVLKVLHLTFESIAFLFLISLTLIKVWLLGLSSFPPFSLSLSPVD